MTRQDGDTAHEIAPSIHCIDLEGGRTEYYKFTVYVLQLQNCVNPLVARLFWRKFDLL